MIRVSVFSKRDLSKYLIKVGFFIIILFLMLKLYNYLKNHAGLTNVNPNKYISCLADEITVMGDKDINNIFEVQPEQIIESEFRMSNSILLKVNNVPYTNENSIINVQELIDDDEIVDVATEVKTEMVDSGIKNTYNYIFKGVKVKNETNYDLNTMNFNTDISVNNKNVLIFHTHTCESYTQTESSKYQESGNFRTTDCNYNVCRVGDELQKYLSSYGYNVIHNKSFHDYPSYSGSYGRSLKTVSNILSKNNDIDVVIDLHRDAIGDEAYAPKVKIGDEYAAQIMFVIGSNGSGLEHDNWKQNLEFAMKVQEKANELYPGLFKPILLRNARYNQHLTKAANIIEIGATGNTLEECETSARYLAKVLNECLN